jgi:hypothetical protein
MTKRIYFFIVHGKLEAGNEAEGKALLENLLNKKKIEYFKIESLMTEANK